MGAGCTGNRQIGGTALGLYLPDAEPGQTKGAGRLREMGLGGFRSVTLAKARCLAADARAALADGADPIKARAHATGGVMTFGAMADALIESMEPVWRNAKHRAQWKMTLTSVQRPFAPDAGGRGWRCGCAGGPETALGETT